MSKGTVIIKKLGGLSTIKSIKGNPREYGQDVVDRDSDGEYIGEYKEPSLPKSRQGLAPIWNDLKDQYCWGGTREDLDVIVDKVRLTFPKGHRKEGELIKPSDVDITNIADPFFTDSKWYNSKYLEGGRVMLNRDLAEDEFFYLIYKGNHLVVDKTKNQNAVFTKGSRYEIINPKVVKARKAESAKETVDALIALSNMEFEKRNLIAEIMDLRTYSIDDVDPDSLFIALKDEAAENNEISSRYGGKTGRERFMELVETENGDLNIMAEIMRAKRLGILRNRGSHWQFNSGNTQLNDRLDGITNETQLINFFRKVDNQDYYIELSKQLELKNTNKT